MLACVKLLVGFQMLACIPKGMSLPLDDLADLTGIPGSQLRRVIRLTSSSGFLQEKPQNHVSHTAISAQFLASQSLCDAAVFIATSVTPSALQMADATRLAIANTDKKKKKNSTTTDHYYTTSYNQDIGQPRSFHAAFQERPKLNRQWKAYLGYAAGMQWEDEMVDIFSRLNWSRLGNACIVEASHQLHAADSTLLGLRPSSRFIIITPLPLLTDRWEVASWPYLSSYIKFIRPHGILNTVIFLSFLFNCRQLSNLLGQVVPSTSAS